MTPMSKACVSPYYYSISIVTIAVSCIVSEMKRDIGDNRDFLYTLHPRRRIAIPFGAKKN